MKSVSAIAFILFLCLALAGCSNGPFDDSRIRYLLEVTALPLNGEQVMVTQQQLECGAQSELWEMQSLGPGLSVGRLLPRGRELKFDDDVQLNDMRMAYTQLRGDFSVSMFEVQSIHDENPTTKLVDAKVGVRINHSCFATPLMLMGVRHGKFTQDFPPRFEFRQVGDDWQYDSIVHQ
jgi:hypothetical protein